MSEGYVGHDLGVTGELHDLDTMYRKGGPQDRTDEVNPRMFPKIPKGSQVVPVHINIVGKPGCGKSTLMNFLCWLAIKKYGVDKLNIVYTDDLNVCYDMINNKPVQLFFVDDATSNASSREIFEQKELAKTFNRQRHVFEGKLMGKPGVIITIFGWQRWKELDPAFRDGDIIIFKTGMAQESEKKIIEDFIGTYYTTVLDGIWDRIALQDNAAKSTSVVRISARSIWRGGVGLYRHEVKENALPPFIESVKYFGAIEEDIEGVLDKLARQEGWSTMVACYRKHVIDGKTQTEVAKELGVRQGYVSESKKKVEAKIKKKK